MKKTTIYLIILAILLSSCNIFPLKPGPGSFHDADITDKEEYAVIQAVIDSLCKDAYMVHVMQNLLQVSDTTMTYVDFYLEQAALDDSLMRADYLAKNDAAHYLDPDSLKEPAVALSLDNYFYYFASSSSDMGFTGYYNDYPESAGIIHLHRPGFNLDANMALMEVLYARHYLGAEAFVIVLEKINSRWVLTHQYPIYSSLYKFLINV